MIDVVENTNAREEREECKEESSADFNTECHTRIFNKRQPKKVADHRYSLSELHPLVIVIEEWKGKSFHQQLRHLIKKNNTQSYIQYTQENLNNRIEQLVKSEEWFEITQS